MIHLMETMKYHFQPMALQEETGTLDFGLLMEILPNIKGKPLYRKFGNFHGLKELNLNFDNLDSSIGFDEELGETADAVVYHPETLNPTTKDEFTYFITDAKNMFYDRANNNRPVLRRGSRIERLPDSSTVGDLVKRMNNMLFCPDKRHSMIKHGSGWQPLPEGAEPIIYEPFRWAV